MKYQNEGFALQEFLIISLFIFLIALPVSLSVKLSKKKILNAENIYNEKIKLENAFKSFSQEFLSDQSPDSTSFFDSLYRIKNIDDIKIEVESLSDKINIYFIDEAFLMSLKGDNKEVFRKAYLFLKNNRKSFSYNIYEDKIITSFLEDEKNRKFFTSEGFADINTIDLRILSEYLSVVCKDNNYSIEEKIKNFRNTDFLVKNISDFKKVIGVNYSDYIPFFSWNNGINVNTCDYELLKNILTKSKADFILRLRKEREILPEDLNGIFSSTPSYVKSLFTTVTSLFKIKLLSADYTMEVLIARDNYQDDKSDSIKFYVMEKNFYENKEKN